MTGEPFGIIIRVIGYLAVGLALVPLFVRVFDPSDWFDCGDFDDTVVYGIFILLWPAIAAGSVVGAIFLLLVYGLGRAGVWVVRASDPGWGPKAGTVAPLTRGEIVAELGAIEDILARGGAIEAQDRIVRLKARAAGAAALGPGIEEY